MGWEVVPPPPPRPTVPLGRLPQHLPVTWSCPHLLLQLCPPHSPHRVLSAHRAATARQRGNSAVRKKGPPPSRCLDLQILCVKKKKKSSAFSSGQTYPRPMHMAWRAACRLYVSPLLIPQGTFLRRAQIAHSFI